MTTYKHNYISSVRLAISSVNFYTRNKAIFLINASILDFNGTSLVSNSACSSSAEGKPQQNLAKQEQLVNIYEKLTTPHTTQELITENQRTAPSLYSLSATITSTGQYIILGDTTQSTMPSNYPPQVPSTSGRY